MKMSSALSIGAIAAAAALTGAATSSETSNQAAHHSPRRPALLVVAGDPVDQGLLQPGYGPVILMNTHSSRADNSGWLQFDLGTCGVLERVDNRNTLLQQSGFDGDDDDPSADGRALLGLWLSEHAEVAVLNDAVDRACDHYWFGDDELETDVIA